MPNYHFYKNKKIGNKDYTYPYTKMQQKLSVLHH